MNQARHANCYQGDQEHPTASALGATEEGDTRMLVGAEPPEKGPGHDSLVGAEPPEKGPGHDSASLHASLLQR